MRPFYGEDATPGQQVRRISSVLVLEFAVLHGSRLRFEEPVPGSMACVFSRPPALVLACPRKAAGSKIIRLVLIWCASVVFGAGLESSLESGPCWGRAGS